jgi:hypothetical protein
MNCRNHPDRNAVAICYKYERGFCLECCDCLSPDECCECLNPEAYCEFRTRCGLWEMARERKRSKRRNSILI